MEAWLSSFPMIPISLVYNFSGMNDSFMNGVGVPSVKCQISISAGIGGQYLPQYNIFCYMSYLITEAWLSSFPMMCTAQSSVPSYRLTILKVVLTLITMIIITMIHTVKCHACHLWIKPVSLGKYRQGIRKSGW